MREARLILPTMPYVSFLETVREINKLFGGSTTYEGTGYWKDLKEQVFIVDVAYEPNFSNDSRLYDIANEYRAVAKQESVYLRYGNGHVQLVTEMSCMDNGETEPFDWEKLRSDLHRAADDPTDIPETPEHVALI